MLSRVTYTVPDYAKPPHLHPVTLAHLFHAIEMWLDIMCRKHILVICQNCSFQKKILILPTAFPQFPAGRSPKTLNGLLSPLCEEAVRVSQSSLCNTLQEKDRSWMGSLAAEGAAMDHSAILPLRYKNLREKSDAHFVEVIKEDRWATLFNLMLCGKHLFYTNLVQGWYKSIKKFCSFFLFSMATPA